MVREYRFELLVRDDGSIISVDNRGEPHKLVKRAHQAAQQLIDELYPTAKPNYLLVTPPQRSAELARKAVSADGELPHHHMSPYLVTLLIDLAGYPDPLNPREAATLFSREHKSTGSYMSMLKRNGFLIYENARYAVTPEGHAYLEDNK